jgi:hypothetical protein
MVMGQMQAKEIMNLRGYERISHQRMEGEAQNGVLRHHGWILLSRGHHQWTTLDKSKD